MYHSFGIRFGSLHMYLKKVVWVLTGACILSIASGLMLAKCRHFNRVTENYRGTGLSNREMTEMNREIAITNREYYTDFLPRQSSNRCRCDINRAPTALDETSIEILQLQSDDALIRRQLPSCPAVKCVFEHYTTCMSDLVSKLLGTYMIVSHV